MSNLSLKLGNFLDHFVSFCITFWINFFFVQKRKGWPTLGIKTILSKIHLYNLVSSIQNRSANRASLYLKSDRFSIFVPLWTVKKPRKRRPWKSVTDQMENWFPCTICKIHTKLGRNQHIRDKHEWPISMLRCCKVSTKKVEKATVENSCETFRIITRF